ncbi:glycosyltransferase family 2 protein, partial [Candidatus Daviesbacteria bacterium]|nr:glycosyltransferase family 2 protein [Candidatus Daviesbacteria bacterium]
MQNGANEGFSGGYNRGMSYAYVWGADYILIINNDALILDANLLQSLIKTFKTDESIGIVSPKIYFAPMFEFHKDRYEEKDLGKVIWYAGGKFDWKNIMSIHRGLDEVDQGQFDAVEETGFVSGCCMMISRKVLEKVNRPESGRGFFDDTLFLYFEDTDFSKRARKKGFKTYYDGATAIYHKASQTSGIGSEITDFFHTRNRLVIGFRYAGLRTRFALLR